MNLRNKMTHFTFEMHSFLDLIMVKKQRRLWGEPSDRGTVWRRQNLQKGTKAQEPSKPKDRFQEKAQREAPECKS